MCKGRWCTCQPRFAGKILAKKLWPGSWRTTSLQDTVVEAGNPCCTLCLVRPLKSSWGEVVTAVGQAEKGTGPMGSQGCVPSGSLADVEAVDEKRRLVQSKPCPLVKDAGCHLNLGFSA